MRDILQSFPCVIFAAVLCYAAVIDHRYRRVKRRIWWWGGGAALWLFLMRMDGGLPQACGLLAQAAIFAALQFCLFARMYGRADCFAFSCCSIFLAAFGGGLREDLLHMLLSILLLGIVQLLRGNVNRQGNLKEPTAFIPYIAASLPGIFLGLVLFPRV